MTAAAPAGAVPGEPGWAMPGGPGWAPPSGARGASSGRPAATARRAGHAAGPRRRGRAGRRGVAASWWPTGRGGPPPARAPSPRSARRAAIESSSSHSNGVDTWPPTLGRTDHAPNTVLCGAFWLKSTNTRLPRSSFHHAAVIRSGRRRSSRRASATAAGPDVVGVPPRLERDVDVDALGPRGLHVGGQSQLGEEGTGLGGGLPDLVEHRRRAGGRDRCGARRRGRRRRRATARRASRGSPG